jgi:hypothetical protein
MIQPSLIATLATGPALGDLRIFLQSLALWTGPAYPTVYVYCDKVIQDALPAVKYPGRLVTKDALTKYTGLSRQQMERVKGDSYPSLWFEFMAEKLNLLDWVFAVEPKRAESAGVLFCDADICFFAPPPRIPDDALVALSRHMIRPSDEMKYGTYNGGFFWFSGPPFVSLWRDACAAGSRFYEQAALEVVAGTVRATQPEAVYEFPRTTNFGWWRMWQSPLSAADVQHEWTMNRMKAGSASSGILVQGQPLESVHTHFLERTDQATMAYNQWILMWLKKLAPAHPPAKRLLGVLLGAGVKLE